MNDKLYIGKLTYQELGSRTAKVLSQNALDEKKITKVLSLISQEKISLIDAINEDECVSITIRIDGHKFWIGILDSVLLAKEDVGGGQTYFLVISGKRKGEVWERLEVVSDGEWLFLGYCFQDVTGRFDNWYSYNPDYADTIEQIRDADFSEKNIYTPINR